MKQIKLVSLISLVLFLSCALQAEKETFSLVLSGGALSSTKKPFYESPIFTGEGKPPFTIMEVTTAYVDKDSVFYGPASLTLDEIIAAPAGKAKKAIYGFVGQSFRGFSLQKQASAEVIRYLSAEAVTVNSETRKIGEKTITAYALHEKAAVKWPQTGAALHSVTAILLKDKQGQTHVVIAREVGDLLHRLGVIDQLMKKNPGRQAFIELGSNHGDARNLVKENIDLLAARKPTVVFAGFVEMAAALAGNKDLSSLPLVYPQVGHYRKKFSFNGTDINFWSLTADEKIWPLLSKKNNDLMTLSAAIKTMQEESQQRDKQLTIVDVFSPEAALQAAKSAYVDVVLNLSPYPYAKLPAREVMELRHKKTDAFPQVAPIITLSYLDVTEVRVFGESINDVARIEINRYPINDESPQVASGTEPDENHMAGLPPITQLSAAGDAWKKNDFEHVLGGIMLAETKADVALFPASPITADIKGAIPYHLAKELLVQENSFLVIQMSGEQLKKINKLLLKTDEQKFVLYGMDRKANTIGERLINDNERFNLALSEQALLKLHNFGAFGGLSEKFTVRAPFVEAIYGDMKSLYFIGGPKVIAVSDTVAQIEQGLGGARFSFDRAVASFLSDPPAASQIKDFLNPAGQPHSVLTFDIAYFDLGFSKNVGNDAYSEYSKILPMGRGKVPIKTSLFLFSKMALTYDMPKLITTLSLEAKYLHPDLSKKPEKDKTKISLRFRLPWERSLFQDEPVVISPMFASVYETKFLPSFWWRSPDADKRTQRIDSLLGFNVDFTALSFDVDVGGVLAADFNRTNFMDALDMGPGINVSGKWPLFGPLELSSEITSYYLFPLSGNTIQEKLAFGLEGTVWLRLMRYKDFSVAALSDFLVASLQDAPRKFAISSIFGLTISYGRLFRLFG